MDFVHGVAKLSQQVVEKTVAEQISGDSLANPSPSTRARLRTVRLHLAPGTAAL
jgi:hypothetical protein